VRRGVVWEKKSKPEQQTWGSQTKLKGRDNEKGLTLRVGQGLPGMANDGRDTDNRTSRQTTRNAHFIAQRQ